MKKYLLVVLGVVLMSGAYVFGDCGMPDCKMKGGMGGEGMHGKMMGGMDDDLRYAGKAVKFKKELNLSKEQEASIEQIRSDYKKAAIQKQADIKVAQLEVTEAMKSDTPDFNAAKEKAKKLYALKLEQKTAMIDAHQKVFNVLTKEQQQKLSELKGAMKEQNKGKMMDHKMHQMKGK
ncbi:MAG TPA: hypothetical protein DEE98_06045 [Elusimicrobia bacterium]|nr:MAG: hypothetical protein A2278_08965 [Elusimicrobia bacterium RIFOXYA12_FULL_49_49]OGS06268.1 MAG: hypothetical protein A2204_05945 [Elusimicrobia bacterium RIFOXYA1_FULL_47_7]OGS11906.1 MAG: hypothetical protein A2386_08465 [Elusimicrobia bacterium RIFOXYB1_FULL_48_9]OGS14916.1 MAG: hypothetical protein A2251_07820 [Elusimicrobia bacterium RIFOXYA2_FULL_47_53]OGS26149.1 MAG: hypothetical protein A2339_02455 [Elusimicrobia bacterium RIFOXYB12_FULL_50_12]OGS29261.1 MAG: hypothetical protein